MLIHVTDHAARRYELRAGRPPEDLRRRLLRALDRRVWPPMRVRRGRVHVNIPASGLDAVLEVTLTGWRVITVLRRGVG